MLNLLTNTKKQWHLAPNDLLTLAARYVDELRTHPADWVALTQQPAALAAQWLDDFAEALRLGQHIWSAGTIRIEQKHYSLQCKLTTRRVTQVTRETAAWTKKARSTAQTEHLYQVLLLASSALQQQQPATAAEALREIKIVLTVLEVGATPATR